MRNFGDSVNHFRQLQEAHPDYLAKYPKRPGWFMGKDTANAAVKNAIKARRADSSMDHKSDDSDGGWSPRFYEREREIGKLHDKAMGKVKTAHLRRAGFKTDPSDPKKAKQVADPGDLRTSPPKRGVAWMWNQADKRKNKK